MSTTKITANNSKPSSSSSSSTNNIIQIGAYKINKSAVSKTNLDFLNPAEDFIGIVECLGNIRHIEKRGEMKSDLEVIDCKVIVGYQSREVEEQTTDGILIRRREEKYENQDVSLVLSKAVLYSKFKRLQEELQSLEGKRIVVIGLGKTENKQYFDFYVELEEKAKQDGVLLV